MIWRAISVRQPWAWLLSNRHKPIENRTRRFNYRGPLLIHASQGMTDDDYEACRIFIEGFTCLELPPPGSLDRGGIVGKAVATDCLTASDSPWFCGPFGIVLSDASPLPFYPCRGSLGMPFRVEFSTSP